MKLSPKEFLLSQGPGFNGAGVLLRAGYPAVMLRADGWGEVHEWCRHFFDESYTWTGSLFWFQFESDKQFFHDYWNLGHGALMKKGYGFAAQVDTSSYTELTAALMSPEMDPAKVTEVISRCRSVGVEIDQDSFQACSIGLQTMEEASKVALLGFSVTNLNLVNYSKRPPQHD